MKTLARKTIQKFIAAFVSFLMVFTISCPSAYAATVSDRDFALTKVGDTDGNNSDFMSETILPLENETLNEGEVFELETDESDESIPEEVTINNEAELRALATAVNEGKWSGYDGVTVNLSSNITLTSEWTPIGTYSNPFKGDFDGQGHTISGLAINASYPTGTSGIIVNGLFGAVKTGSVKNTKVSGTINLKFEKKDPNSGYIEAYTGGIAGYLRGSEVSNCTSSVAITIEKAADTTYDISDASTESCAFTGTGGIAGYVSSEYVSSSEYIASKIEDCENKESISVFFTGINETIGGIVGTWYNTNSQAGTINRCANYGKITYDLPNFENGNTGEKTYGSTVDFQYGNVGGIVGDAQNVSISSSCNKGNFTGKASVVGGIAGCSINNNKVINLYNCYNSGNLTVNSKPAGTTAVGVGGLIGAHCGKAGTGAISGGVAPNNGIYSAQNCYNAGSIVVTETDELYTANIYTSPLLLLDNGTSSNNYSELVSATTLGSAYKEDTNKIQEGWPLLSWESEEAVAAEYTVSFTSNTDAQISLFYDKENNNPVEKTSDTYTLKNGTYYYHASADGYIDEAGSIKVNNEDLTTNITLFKAVSVNVAAAPVNATITVVDDDGNTIAADINGQFTLKQGKSYTYTAAKEGYISYSEDFSATDGLELNISLTSAEGVTEVTGSAFTITQAGTYHVPTSFSGMIYLETDEEVTIVGNGIADSAKCENVFIDATVGEIKLTLKDIFISDTANTANAIDIDETGNILSIEGKVVVDYNVGYTSENDALIHVATGETLTIKGSGTYYQYNCTQGAGIGGNTGEMNGDITFAMTGSAFIKGTRQGAVIGAGAAAKDTGTPGKVTFESGNYNLISNSRGAVIGGSAGSSGASEGTEVYFNGGCININVDWSGAAVGGGGYNKGNDASGGTAYFGGASVRVYVDKNAAANLSEGWNGKPIAEGINDAAITAQRLNTNGEKVYRCAVDTSLLESTKASDTYTVCLDGDENAFYEGGLHEWGYVQEKLDKETGEQLSITSTISNWYKIDEPCLYLYLTSENHQLNVNGETLTAKWDSETETFTVEKVAEYDGLLGDVNFNNRINVVDAQIAYEISNGMYTTHEKYETMRLAADVNKDGFVDAADAFAIQVYVHAGEFVS